MKQLVIMPGGFHPFHAGHAALYQSAVEAFPGADVYVAATNDTSTRPFPFPVKEKLAQLAGVPKGRFMQVKSPFRAEEITASYDPNTTQLIFVRSEKDAGSQPRAGGNKKDGSPGYLQPYDDASDLPMSQHAYMAYLPTVEFGPGMTSATEIRGAWPQLNEKRKTALVMSLYPKTQTNPKLAATVVKLLDTAIGAELNEGDVLAFPDKTSKIGSQRTITRKKGNITPLPQRTTNPNVTLTKNQKGQTVAQGKSMYDVYEGDVVPFARPGQALTWQQVPKDVLLLANDWFWASEDNSGLDATIDPDGYGNGTANDVKYLAAKLQQKGWTIDYNDEYDAPRGPFNLRLTNKRGQTVLLSIEDAQDFSGWAEGTSSLTENQGRAATYENTAPNPRVNLTPNFPNYATLVGEFVGIKKNRALFRIIAAELRPGQGETEKIFRAMSTNTPIGIEIGKVKNRAVLENTQKEFILYIDGKPAAKYVDQQQAILDMAAVRKKYPAARLELKHEVCDMQTVKQINEGGSILEVLKPDAFAALQQAKQNIEQNRQQEVDQWAQDFRANSSKLAGQQLKQRLAAPPPAPIPVAKPGEGYYALKDRLAQLDIAKQKFEEFNKLIASIKKKYPLVADTLDQLENSLLQDVKDGAADNYASLLAKLNKYENALTTRFPGIVKEDPDYIEEGRKI